MWTFELQRFATAGPNPGSGRVRRRRNAGRGRGPAAVICPLRRPARAGRRLARQAASAKAPAVAPKPTPPPVTPALTAKYVVQPGDTLHRIAHRFGTTARLLAELNELHKPVLLVPGEILLVPDGNPG